MSSIVVLKFGGSFLRGPADLVAAVHLIYAEVRAGRKVVAVTSAFHGRTDELERSLEALDAQRGERSSERVRAALLSSGEIETSALLVAALERSGVPARHADVRRYGPFVEPGGSDPIRLDTDGLRALFDDAQVICLPGFLAVEDTPEREPALLGRGGSDLTAVFVGSQLVARVALVKDVEGLYTSDPAGRGADAPLPRRLARVSFDDALQLGPDILQPRALRHAASNELAFDVVGPGSVAGVRGTEVSRRKTIEREDPEAPPPLRVALLGLGTVGERVFADLSSAPDRFEVVSVLVRSLDGKARPHAARRLLTTDFDDVLASQPDLIIEATVGAEPAGRWIRTALSRGVHVVSANKVAVARSVPSPERVARASGAHFLASAAVGGALPALEAVRRAAVLASGTPSGSAADKDRLIGVEGVLNGTSNFVLTAIERGASFEDAVRDAQARGLAEADPTGDLDGSDIAHKLELLARAAGWTQGASGTDRLPASLRWLHQSGIDAKAAEPAGTWDSEGRWDAGGLRAPEGKRLRLVGSAQLSDVGPVASVSLRSVPKGDPLYDVVGTRNRLVLHFASGRSEVISGTGAGAWPTATSILGDIHAIARRLSFTRRVNQDAAARRSTKQ